MIGEVLCDRYQIQEQLGKRAGQQTLLARDLTTGELVVVKLLSFGNDFEWEHLKLFEREAETLKALSHPAIPRYLDYLQIDLPTGKGFALVQTYVEGKSLEEHLKAGRKFTEASVKQLAKALLKILIYLHGLKPSVIHRDIKPSNILLTNRSGNRVGNVYLVDFGSVQTLAATEGGTITVVGTYGYMPPEQFGGRTVPASDLYSLGATLIYLVTGTHPADLPQKDGQIVFEQAANISPGFAYWLRGMVEPSLDRRFHSGTEALQAIKRQPKRDVTDLVANKPAGSKVLLASGADYLQIIIPMMESNYDLEFIPWYLLCVNSLLLLITTSTGLSVPFPVSLLYWLLSLPLWGIMLMIVLWILFNFCGQVRLRISGKRISLKYELFGLKYSPTPPASRKYITKLILTKRSFTTRSKNSQYNPVEVKPRIIIWAGKHKYEIGEYGLLREPELEWLALELSNCLGLPITRE
jgi:serine/threonine protein kinase